VIGLISPYDGVSIKFVIDKMDEIFTLIDSLGISINKQCRFYRFRNSLIKEYKKEKEFQIKILGESSFSKEIDFAGFLERMSSIGEGLRDFYELWSIASSKVILKDNLTELALIFGGNINPMEDKLSNTRPRDLQYQLFLTSFFELSGNQVVSAEPDFKFVHHNEEIAVACKRINSKTQAIGRVKEAAKQINVSGRRGFIAISLDSLVGINFYQHTTDAVRLNEHATELMRQTFNSTIPRKSFQFDKNILGLIVNMGILGGNILTERLNYTCACDLLIFNQGDSKMNDSLIQLGKNLKINRSNLM
jgi:hypothetical protein